jgi:hypothetical protein
VRSAPRAIAPSLPGSGLQDFPQPESAGEPPSHPDTGSDRAPLVIITPCGRPQLLRSVYKSIQLGVVARWIIVFDADRVPHEELAKEFNGPQITLAAVRVPGSKYGNAQRKLGVEIARALYEDDALLYFLDDDNLVHPMFYRLFQQFMWRRDVFYTFDQRRSRLICSGKRCVRVMMDTAMICVPLSLCPDWRPSAEYAEDYHFVRSVMRAHRQKHVYLNSVAAYYNALQPGVLARVLGAQHQRTCAIAGSVATLVALAITALKLIP